MNSLTLHRVTSFSHYRLPHPWNILLPRFCAADVRFFLSVHSFFLCSFFLFLASSVSLKCWLALRFYSCLLTLLTLLEVSCLILFLPSCADYFQIHVSSPEKFLDSYFILLGTSLGLNIKFFISKSQPITNLKSLFFSGFSIVNTINTKNKK